MSDLEVPNKGEDFEYKLECICDMILYLAAFSLWTVMNIWLSNIVWYWIVLETYLSEYELLLSAANKTATL